jgi:hypothetical protein
MGWQIIMWLMILFWISFVIAIAFIESPGWFWRMMFWIEMRLPKWIDKL